MDIEKEALIKRIAGMVAVGAQAVDIARALNTTVQKVRYYMGQELCKSEVNKLLDEATSDAVSKAKKQMAMLVPKAIKALEQKLDEDADLKAAEMVLKGIGALAVDDKPQQATAIQVVLPGGETQTIVQED